jgi:hypothetical protein
VGQVEEVPRSSTRCSDPGEFGLVPQHGDGPADLPLPQPKIVPPSGRKVQDAAGIADGQRPDPLLHRPLHDGLGGFVLGLPDPPSVPAFNEAGAAAVLPPSPRPVLARFRCAGGGGPAAALGVGEVHPVFGADRPPGHE